MDDEDYEEFEKFKEYKKFKEAKRKREGDGACGCLVIALIIIVALIVSSIRSCFHDLLDPPLSYETCYTIADANLRSSDRDVNSHILATLPYGSELSDCKLASVWFHATISSSEKDGSKKGYVHQSLIMAPEDFVLMNSVWGTPESRKAVEKRGGLSTSGFNRALLAYYREKGYSGKLAAEEKSGVGLGKDAEEWQAFMRPGEVKYGKLVPNSPGIGFLIENEKGGKRKFLYFYKEGKELFSEQDAPKCGDIASITYDKNKKQLKVEYKKCR